MKIVVLPNSGIVVNEAEINGITGSKDFYRRNIGWIEFNDGTRLKVEVPNDWAELERRKTDSDEIYNGQFKYLRIAVRNQITKVNFGSPVVRDGIEITEKVEKLKILLWVSNKIIQSNGLFW